MRDVESTGYYYFTYILRRNTKYTVTPNCSSLEL